VTSGLRQSVHTRTARTTPPGQRRQDNNAMTGQSAAKLLQAIVRGSHFGVILRCMRLPSHLRQLACASVLILYSAACRTPNQVAGEPESPSESCRIEFNFVPDPNDQREVVLEVLIFP